MHRHPDKRERSQTRPRDRSLEVLACTHWLSTTTALRSSAAPACHRQRFSPSPVPVPRWRSSSAAGPAAAARPVAGVLLDIGQVPASRRAAVLAAVLAESPVPATRVLERFGRCSLRFKKLASGGRPLTDREHYRLAAGALHMCRYRHGLLVTGSGLVAASVSLVWLPARIPHDACRELEEGDTPAGVILEPLGMVRQDRRAMATRMDDCVTGQPLATASSAVLAIGGQPVAIAEEFVLASFAERCP